MIRLVCCVLCLTMVAASFVVGLVGGEEITSSSSNKNGTSVCDVLPKYGLPACLLPDAVKTFSLSESDGSFVVDLERPCYVQTENLLWYGSTITGILRYGSITGLKGIKWRRFYVWYDVNEIKVDLPPSDSIYFQVGLISKRLDVAEFSKPRSCKDDSCRWWDSFSFKLPEPVMEARMLRTE